MNILGYLQKIGRALMVPVAVLPAAAILMGVGYWIDPNGWGGDSALAAFLIKAGLSKEGFVATGAVLAALVDGVRLMAYGHAALAVPPTLEVRA